MSLVSEIIEERIENSINRLIKQQKERIENLYGDVDPRDLVAPASYHYELGILEGLETAKAMI